MTEKLLTIKKMTGTHFIKGKRVPHKMGKIHDIVFFPDKKCVAGFLTKRSDLLLMFKRKGHFISIKGYYIYEDLAFARHEKGSIDKAAYRALGLDPNECVRWLGLPVITEDGQNVGIVSDVTFVHQSGEVRSIEASQGSIGKLIQGSRTIPTNLIKGYRGEDGITLVHAKEDEGENDEIPQRAILVANEALEIDIDTDNTIASKAGKQVSQIADNVGVDTSAVSEKAKSAAQITGGLIKSGAVATGKQLKKTKGMFSAFKEEYNKARHDD